MLNLDIHIVLYIALGMLAILFIWIVFLHFKIRKLLGGSSAKNIEEGLSTMRKDLESMPSWKSNSEKRLAIIEKKLSKSIQGLETVRFNPFKGSGDGGNQSFSTALVNEKGDGVVLSSLYSRERVSVFSKPLHGFASEYELSDEEKDVIAKTKQSLANN